jgi:glycosyltransferase involved in cell wall biosynthesis
MDDPDFSVSVVIPAYNSAATIGRAIDSVLSQTRPPEQIIVVNDGSTDGTAVAVSEYGGRIDSVRQPNAGPGAARNLGIQEAKYPWIAFLDADDEWLPDRLERQIGILQAHPDLAWVTGNFLRSDSQGRSGPHFAVPENSLRPERMSFYMAFIQNLWGCTDTLLIRREVFERAGQFRGEYKTTEDLDMWFRIAFQYPDIGIVYEPLAIYHLDTPDSLIKSRSQDVEALVDFLSRNLRLAEQHGKASEFAPCASLLLRKWIRAMLFAGLGSQARRLSRQFGNLLAWHFRLGVWIASLCPGLTAAALRSMSRLARAVGLRRGPTRKPSPS